MRTTNEQDKLSAGKDNEMEKDQAAALLSKSDELKEGNGEDASPRYMCCVGGNALGCFVRLLVFVILVLSIGSVVPTSQKAEWYKTPRAGISSSAKPRGSLIRLHRESYPNTTTVVPTEERSRAILEWLVKQGISTRDDLEQADSPQARACQFMATQDMQLPLDTSGDDAEYNNYLSRYVLTVFFYSTNGEHWKYGMKFTSEEHHCKWMKIIQYEDFSTEYRGVLCDQSSQTVVALFMSKCCLALFGFLPCHCFLLALWLKVVFPFQKTIH